MRGRKKGFHHSEATKTLMRGKRKQAIEKEVNESIEKEVDESVEEEKEETEDLDKE